MYARINELNVNDKLQVWNNFKKYRFLDFDQRLSYTGAVVKSSGFQTLFTSNFSLSSDILTHQYTRQNILSLLSSLGGMKEALLLIFIVLASHYNNRLMISKLIRNIYHVQVPESKTYSPSKAHCFNKWCLCTYSRSRKQKTLN